VSFLQFKLHALGSDRKTQEWGVESNEGWPLGVINWFSSWRRYVFSPIGGTVYDTVCLREIAEFCGAKTDAQKATWK
jgi:hypothetical protein